MQRDGVDIPEPTEQERAAFEAWAKRNGINEPLHPDHHYDNVGAFRAGIDRDKGTAHFPDTFKLPGHETFSNESKYATGANAKYAGRWNGDKYIPAKARFKSMADDEFEDVTDEFEPVSAPAPQTDQQRQQSLLDKFKAVAYGAGQGALLGFGDELSGVHGALSEKIAAKLGYGEDRPFGDIYRESRDFARNEYKAAQEQNPWLYGAGGIMGALGGGGLAANAGLQLAARGGRAIAEGAGIGALSGVGGSRSDLTNGELGGVARDAAGGAAVGAITSAVAPIVIDKVAGALKNPIAKTKEALGNAMQMPQRAYEAVAERVGRSSLAQRSSSAASDVGGVAASAKVRALRQIRDDAEFGSALASTLRSATERLGGTGGKLVSAMTAEERGQVASAMAELLHSRGMAEATPEFVLSNMEGLAKAAGTDIGNLTGNTFLRLANKRDPQWWVSAGEGVRKFWMSRGMAGEAMAPQMQQQFAGNAGLADDFALGKLDRLGRPMGEAGPGVYQNSVAAMEGKLPQNAQQVAAQQVRAADAASAEARSIASEAANKTNPGFRRGGIVNNEHTDTEVLGSDAVRALRQAARAAYMRSPAGQAAMAGEVDAVNQNIAARAQPGQGGQTIDQLLAPARELQVAGANRQLRDIATGRNFLEQKALPLAGAVFGGASGGGMGALGVLSGVPLGGAVASRAPRVADALGEIGQGLSTSGRDEIRQSALRMASDPFKLRRLADVPGVVGNGARWALEVARDPAAFAARSYMLTMRPEFRKALAGDDEADRAAR